MLRTFALYLLLGSLTMVFPAQNPETKPETAQKVTPGAPIQVVGFSVRTTNAAEAKGDGEIPKLWNRFFQENLGDKIPHRVGQSLSSYIRTTPATRTANTPIRWVLPSIRSRTCPRIWPSAPSPSALTRSLPPRQALRSRRSPLFGQKSGACPKPNSAANDPSSWTTKRTTTSPIHKTSRSVSTWVLLPRLNSKNVGALPSRRSCFCR